MEILAGNWILRPWQPGDEAALVKYGNNWKIWINLRDSFPHPYTADRATNWVRLHQSSNKVNDFAIANAEEAIGGIGFTILGDASTGRPPRSATGSVSLSGARESQPQPWEH